MLDRIEYGNMQVISYNELYNDTNFHLELLSNQNIIGIHNKILMNLVMIAYINDKIKI